MAVGLTAACPGACFCVGCDGWLPWLHGCALRRSWWPIGLHGVLCASRPCWIRRRVLCLFQWPTSGSVSLAAGSATSTHALVHRIGRTRRRGSLRLRWLRWRTRLMHDACGHRWAACGSWRLLWAAASATSTRAMAGLCGRPRLGCVLRQPLALCCMSRTVRGLCRLHSTSVTACLRRRVWRASASRVGWGSTTR